MPFEVVDADPIGDLPPDAVALAQHFRETWDLMLELPPVMGSRYLAALAVDFLRLRWRNDG